ncbi:MAG: histidinol dehydrogenase [Solimicrobium sp.]|nr:histidinol dehydrogenase [Solimicrobium sp.]
MSASSTFNIAKLSSTDLDFQKKLTALLAFESNQDETIERAVAKIVSDVKQHGDTAVLAATKRFDRLTASSIAELEISYEEMQNAFNGLTPERRNALTIAAERVRAYHQTQQQECGSAGFSYTEADGTMLGQKVTPLDRVGIYVPGGKAAYPSSVLMNAIPAKVAGVAEIIMVVPTPDGVQNPLVLAAAFLAGVDRIFTIGGAQAIGALAYGTETIPAVDKIVGPGNAYVAAAKRRVFGTVGIDMIAGPSEILVLCDGTTNPDWIAMDLFSQAEHDELAQSILLCPNADYIAEVQRSMHRLIDAMPRKEIICTSLANRGALILVRDMDEACDIANSIAAEHVEISTENPAQWAAKIRHGGALFLGRFSSEALGDYCAGPNHVLPTSRTARFSSPLGVYDFQKRSSMITISEAGAQTLGKVAAVLAYGEGLQAHARSAELRLKGDLDEK